MLSQLEPLKLRQLKHKAVFDLKSLDKQGKLNGTRDPAVNLYIDSWLQDTSAGCRPTWRNLLVILGDIGLGEMARKIKKLFSRYPVTIVAGKKYIIVALVQSLYFFYMANRITIEGDCCWISMYHTHQGFMWGGIPPFHI